MALDLQAVREAVKEVIRSGVERSNLNVHAKWPATALIAPAVVIFPADTYVEPHTAMSKGAATVNLEVRLYAGDSTAGQDLLDDMLSAGAGKANSVLDAIESGRRTGSNPYPDPQWSDLHVSAIRYFGRVSAEENSQTFFYAATVDLAVYLPRS
jgi:hypothetical protein